MIKTLLLCFIHGFKGDDETFFNFPEDLRNLIIEKEKELDVRTAVYPKYETRGDLAGCVTTFQEWLQDKVTDLEREAGTQQAILNPSVGVVLVAHSMGGFVAADALFSALDNRPISADSNVKLMFPLIQGLVAFDTPYNGLSRSMFAYGAFSQYQNISSLWNIGTSVGSLLTAGGAAASSSQVVARQNPSWRRWQTLASRTGTYGAIVAGGVAVYMNRSEIAQTLSRVNKESISESWAKINKETIAQGLGQIPAYVSRESVGEGFAWMASHLKFVGALMKQEQLKIRLERLSQLKGLGVVNFYTSLGENGYWSGGYFFPKRTFCAIPTNDKELQMFREQPNTKAGDEIAAHCSMFRPEKNSLYQNMTEGTRDLVLEWIKNDLRKVVDEYKPDREQRNRSMSEAQLFDDDGKVLDQHSDKTRGDAEDELQLQAILRSQNMPQLEDGGINEEDLKRAMEVPLPPDDAVADGDVPKQEVEPNPAEDQATKTWRSRLSNPFSRVSLPSVRIPFRKNSKDDPITQESITKDKNASSVENSTKEAGTVNLEPLGETESHEAEEPPMQDAVRVMTRELPKDEDSEAK